MLSNDIKLPHGTTYILAIDTTAYAGNFERQMAAYVAGAYDIERCHGDKELQEFLDDAKEEGWLEAAEMLRDAVATVMHAEYGEVSNTIRATPGRFNNGMGYTYDADDPEAAIIARENAKESAAKYHADQIARCEQRLKDEDFEEGKPGAWTKEACERTIAAAQDFIARAGEFISFPSYESVAVFFSRPLMHSEMKIIRERAKKFAARPMKHGEPFSIRDVYMVAAKLAITETRIEL